MFSRTLRQHALAAALALSAAAAAGWGAWHSLALKTETVPAAAPGIYIPNLGNTLDEQTRNLSRMSQALRTGDRLVILGSSELTSNDLRFVPYRYLADELQMPVLAYGHSGFQSLGMQLVLAALAEDLSPASRVVVMLSPGWFDGDGGLGADEFKEHANPLLPRLLKQPEGRAELTRWLNDKGDASVIWSMIGEQAYVFRQRLVDLWAPAYAATAPEREREGPAAAARVVDWDELANQAQSAEQSLMTGNRYAVRDEFFNKYLRAIPEGGKTAYLPQPLTGRDELRELTALMALLHQHHVQALFVMQPLHPMVFKDLARFEPVQQQVAALCQRYAMQCMDMYSAPFEIGMLRDVQHLGELGWLRVNQRIAEVFRP
ncbi:D-alanyl-lipoteichoic acid biosynthesis protein DltD [Achromobacter seleniivolatilans]|uniref:D-alanyl-lipoteichoic acid biosynthesis protein DltD n=1 Tax=Achromobacter seleniivolatilans TaxID=3047478 RepID=A0ABY9M0N4_9BURK|nr:D-alanyl-lipoteichoic acid biosynthesis protein DltD [Achromobacter sp. R39]WMD20559.1 D-alanyl-lipoteichoic acid biosynthesis protein DltD [Achromobacter sp. R39]